MPAHSNGSGPDASDRSTLVMGAGPGGLCSAYVLSKAGVPTTVVEKAPFVGGLARTIRQKPSTANSSSISVVTAGSPRTTSSTTSSRKSSPRRLLWVNRISRIYFDGKYVDYPLKIGNALKAIGPVACGEGDGRLWRASGSSRSCSPTTDRLDGGRLHRSVRPNPLRALLPALLGEGLGPALRRDERRLGLAAIQGHVACHCGQGRDRSVEGQSR